MLVLLSNYLFKDIAAATAEEDEFILSVVHPHVEKVLRTFACKKVAFMREVLAVVQPLDDEAVMHLVLGLPMLGWAAVARGLMQRVLQPTATIEEFLEDREPRNAELIRGVKSSGDEELDRISFRKTLEEVAAGTMVGPFTDLSQVPVDDPAVARRHGIWEQHGDSEAPAVRNIDDLLMGEQNTTAGTWNSHRPTDVDALIAQCRAAIEALKQKRLRGWKSDFAKPYKQVPGAPVQVHLIVLVQWDPASGGTLVGKGGGEGGGGRGGGRGGRGQMLSSINSSNIGRNANERKPPKPKFD